MAQAQLGRHGRLREPAAALLVATAAVITVGFATLVFWMVTSDVVNFQGVEINVIFTIQKAMLGSALYTSPALPPFDVAQYSPLYYWVVIIVAKALGVSGMDPAPVAVIGRALSAAFALGAVVLYFRILADLTRDRSLIRILVTISFVVAATFPWLFLARPDSLATFLSFAAIYLLVRCGERERFDAISYTIAVILAILTIVAKQNDIVPIGLLLLTALIERNFRALVIAGALVALAGSIALLTIPGVPFLKANIIDGVNNGVDLRWAFMHAYHYVFVWCLPLIFIAILTVARLGRPWTREQRIIIAAAVLYLTTAAVFSLKWGSAPNYYVEFVFFASAIICAGWDRLGNMRRYPELEIVVAMYLALFLVVRFGNQYRTYVEDARIPTERFEGWNSFTRFFSSRLSHSPQEYVLPLDLGLAAKMPLASVIPSPEIAERAHRRGLVDYSCFQRLVSSGRVRYMVTIGGWKPSEFAGADLTTFRLIGRIGDHWISENTVSPPIAAASVCG